MKKMLPVALVLASIFFLASNGSSQEKVDHNLDWYVWTELTTTEKVTFIRGWIEGGFIASMGMCKAISATTSKDYDECQKLAINVFKEKGIEFDDLNLLQVVQTIDKLYSDPRVKRWKITDIMPIVRGRLKEGWTEREIDEVIGYYIRHKGWNKRFDEALRKSSAIDEMKPIINESRSLESNKPRVLKALEAYKFEGRK